MVVPRRRVPQLLRPYRASVRYTPGDVLHRSGRPLLPPPLAVRSGSLSPHGMLGQQAPVDPLILVEAG